MTDEKLYVKGDIEALPHQIGRSLENLFRTVDNRRSAGELSYTYRLLNADPDTLLKKVLEEAGELALAAKDVEAQRAPSADAQNKQAVGLNDDTALSAYDHLRYEAADVLYHLLVVLARYDISLDEFAAELNSRMTDEECPKGSLLVKDAYIKRS